MKKPVRTHEKKDGGGGGGGGGEGNDTAANLLTWGRWGEFIYEEKIPVLFNKLKEEQRKSSALNLQEDFYFFQKAKGKKGENGSPPSGLDTARIRLTTSCVVAVSRLRSTI
ncbi:hypothetical protein F2P79_025056 [Pimephales promelas]|nr:hypothetical protein F2P79_025056 [Pimephales promelas]